MVNSGLKEVEIEYKKAIKAHDKKVDQKWAYRNARIEEVEKEVENLFDKEIEDLRIEREACENNVNAYKIIDAQENDTPPLIGSILYEINWSDIATGKKGVIEIFTPQSKTSKKTYVGYNPYGDKIIRLFKKDGTSGLTYFRLDSYKGKAFKTYDQLNPKQKASLGLD